jgi:flagellar biosynthesis GTPase FlhF
MRVPHELQGFSQKISGSRFVGSLLGRRKKEATVDIVPQYAEDFVDIPPPVPSKDLPPIPNEKRTPSPPVQVTSPPPHLASTSKPPAPPPGRSHTSSRWSPPKAVPVVKQRSAPVPMREKREPSPPIILGEDFTVLTPFDVDGYSFGEIPTPKPNRVAYPMDVRTTSLPRKWAVSRENLLSDPEERERRRLERVKQQEEEEKLMLEQEQKIQEDRRREREAERKREEEEEQRRQRELKEQLKRIAVEKEKMRKMEQEEEERTRREIEERKRLDKERRLEEHRKLEIWRKEQDRLRDEEARKVALEKKREEVERSKKIEKAEKEVVKSHDLTGYITIQFPESLFWKRRYFRLMGNTLNLYRNQKVRRTGLRWLLCLSFIQDTTTPMEEVHLRGKIKALKEWSDGYEDLEAIPFSFVIEFHDQTWSVFADSEDDKFRVLGLLKHTSGL